MTEHGSTRGRWIAGVDGCRGGWIAFRWNLDGPLRECRAALHGSFADVLAERPGPLQAAVDMPIGLLDVPVAGGRCCDALGRRRLGVRACTLFTPPHRGLLEAASYEAVRGEGLTLQAFHILPKIREVDRLLGPRRQQVYREAHPELAFGRLAGVPLRSRKRTAAGRTERLGLLARQRRWRAVASVYERVRQQFPRRLVADDDIVDALVLLHVARDMVEERAQRLPDRPQRDSRGLRMEIWY